MFESFGSQTEMVLLDVSRVRNLLERRPQARNRFFSLAEQAYCDGRKRNPYQHFAVRLAAKMAARRLAGQGPLGRFEVKRADLGAPILVDRREGTYESIRFAVSLSHEGDKAVALVACLDTYEV